MSLQVVPFVNSRLQHTISANGRRITHFGLQCSCRSFNEKSLDLADSLFDLGDGQRVMNWETIE